MIRLDYPYIVTAVTRYLKSKSLSTKIKSTSGENLEVTFPHNDKSDYFFKFTIHKKFKLIYFYCMPIIPHPNNKPYFHMYFHLEEFSHEAGVVALIKEHLSEILLYDSKIVYKNGLLSFSSTLYLMKKDKWKKYYSASEFKLTIPNLTYKEFQGKEFLGFI